MLQEQIDDQTNEQYSTDYWSENRIRGMGQEPGPGYSEEQKRQERGDDGCGFPSPFEERHAKQSQPTCDVEQDGSYHQHYANSPDDGGIQRLIQQPGLTRPSCSSIGSLHPSWDDPKMNKGMPD